jgi:hypothetical protein
MDQDPESTRDNMPADETLALFARALSLLLYENEGVVVYDDSTPPQRFVVYYADDSIQIVQTADDLGEGELVHIQQWGNFNPN